VRLATLTLSLLLALSLLLSRVVAAHHSFAQFDANQLLTVTGVVQEFQWTNPHVYLEVRSLTAAGDEQVWLLESSSPNQLTRAGWSRSAIHVGDQLKLEFHPLKTGQRGGWLVKCTLPDGRVFGG
jgi:hypothetical protein